MSPTQLLAELRRRQVDLVVVDDYRLHWHAPPGALTRELQQALHAAQVELIQLLRSAAVGQPQRILVQPGP